MIAVVLFKVFIVFYAKFLFPILDGNRGQIPLNDDPILPLDPEYWVGEFRRDFDRPVQSVERSWQIGGTLLTLVVILVAVDACGIL